MGNLASKIGEEIIEDEPATASIPSTPILTPKIRNLEDLDPRSPSTNIIRTPIQMLLSPNTSNSDNTSDTFNINSPKIGTDPRSPSVDFTRTPIVFNENNKLPHKLYNKNFDNVRKTLINVTPKKISEMSSYVPPKLLQSSPLTLKPNENKRKSFVGLLETNLDYIETDLDSVIQNKTPVKGGESKIKISTPTSQELKIKFLENDFKTPINILKNENADPRSPTTDFTRTPIQITKKVGEIDLNVSIPNENEVVLVDKNEVVNDDENKVVIDDDGLVRQTKIENDTPKNNITDKNCETEIVDNNFEIINNTAENLEVNLQENQKIVEVVTPKILQKKEKINENLNDFDKKISTLIYNDEDDLDSNSGLRHRHVQNKESKRTPLGVRNGQPKKSIPKLKVSDKPRKLDYAVSKIPVFKTKSKIQCENTPPRNMIETKNKNARLAKWDNDNTLII